MSQAQDRPSSFKAASQIKKSRATKADMEVRAEFLITYAKAHGPVTVRGLYYQAEVAGIPGIDKSEDGYNKVQELVLELRRSGRLPYELIADEGRFLRCPQTYDGWQSAIQETADTYLKALWVQSPVVIQFWLEKSALTGVLAPITFRYDVGLMATSGYASETCAYEQIKSLEGSGQSLIVYTLYDFDRSGRDAEKSLREKLERFGMAFGIPVEVKTLGLTLEQVIELELPTREPKRNTAADLRWPHDFAAELDAIPPDTLRSMVRSAIERHMSPEEFQRLKLEERAERAKLLRLAEGSA